MKGYLLDTNVISETRKTRPDKTVLSFIDRTSPESKFLSVLGLGELRKGAAVYRYRHRIDDLALLRWIQRIETNYADRLLAVEIQITRMQGHFQASARDLRSTRCLPVRLFGTISRCDPKHPRCL